MGKSYGMFCKSSFAIPYSAAFKFSEFIIFHALSLLIIFLLSIPGRSQHVGHKLYTVADGLVQSEVTCIHQDKKGFLWVGTKNGVSFRPVL